MRSAGCPHRLPLPPAPVCPIPQPPVLRAQRETGKGVWTQIFLRCPGAGTTPGCAAGAGGVQGAGCWRWARRAPRCAGDLQSHGGDVAPGHSPHGASAAMALPRSCCRPWTGPMRGGIAFMRRSDLGSEALPAPTPASAPRAAGGMLPRSQGWGLRGDRLPWWSRRVAGTPRGTAAPPERALDPGAAGIGTRAQRAGVGLAAGRVRGGLGKRRRWGVSRLGKVPWHRREPREGAGAVGQGRLPARGEPRRWCSCCGRSRRAAAGRGQEPGWAGSAAGDGSSQREPGVQSERGHQHPAAGHTRAPVCWAGFEAVPADPRLCQGLSVLRLLPAATAAGWWAPRCHGGLRCEPAACDRGAPRSRPCRDSGSVKRCCRRAGSARQAGFAAPLPTGTRGRGAGSTSRASACAAFLGARLSSRAPRGGGRGSGGTAGTAARLVARRAAPPSPQCQLGGLQGPAGQVGEATSQQVTGFVVASPGAAGIACGGVSCGSQIPHKPRCPQPLSPHPGSRFAPPAPSRACSRLWRCPAPVSPRAGPPPCSRHIPAALHRSPRWGLPSISRIRSSPAWAALLRRGPWQQEPITLHETGAGRDPGGGGRLWGAALGQPLPPRWRCQGFDVQDTPVLAGRAGHFGDPSGSVPAEPGPTPTLGDLSHSPSVKEPGGCRTPLPGGLRPAWNGCWGWRVSAEPERPCARRVPVAGTPARWPVAGRSLWLAPKRGGRSAAAGPCCAGGGARCGMPGCWLAAGGGPAAGGGGPGCSRSPAPGLQHFLMIFPPSPSALAVPDYKMTRKLTWLHGSQRPCSSSPAVQGSGRARGTLPAPALTRCPPLPSCPLQPSHGAVGTGSAEAARRRSWRAERGDQLPMRPVLPRARDRAAPLRPRGLLQLSAGLGSPSSTWTPSCQHPFSGFQAWCLPADSRPRPFAQAGQGRGRGRGWGRAALAGLELKPWGLSCEPGPCWLHPRSGYPVGTRGPGVWPAGPGSGDTGDMGAGKQGRDMGVLPRCRGSQSLGRAELRDGVPQDRGSGAVPEHARSSPGTGCGGEQPPAWGEPPAPRPSCARSASPCHSAGRSRPTAPVENQKRGERSGSRRQWQLICDLHCVGSS